MAVAMEVRRQEVVSSQFKARPTNLGPDLPIQRALLWHSHHSLFSMYVVILPPPLIGGLCTYTSSSDSVGDCVLVLGYPAVDR